MNKILLIICGVILSFNGCAKPAPPPTLTQAQAKFHQICKDEHKYNVTTQFAGNTLWIYLPIKERILDIKAFEQGPQNSNQPKEQLSLRYIDAKFENNRFNVEYDVSLNKTYLKDSGYTSTYSDEYQKIQTNILYAISQSFFDVDKKEPPPEFIMMVVADIEKGIEMESLIYFEDLIRAMSLLPSLPQEEFSKRYVTELRGNKKIIDDTTGKHLNIHTVTFEEFLAKQIAYRISLKYQHSILPPSENTIEEILPIIRETLQNYSFSEFDGIDLLDLDHNALQKINK